MTLFRNVLLWLRGFSRLRQIAYKPGWSARKFLPLYLVDYGVNVLTGGAVESISRRAERHRQGRLWDWLLDLIERLDPQHGRNAGPALWGSVEAGKAAQVAAVIFWLVVIVWVA